MQYDHSKLKHIYDGPAASALMKQAPEDFVVEEVLGFEPDGEGEHHFLWVEKRQANTAEVAERIARQLGLSPRAVTWSGLKDRQAVTRQWFGVHWPGQPELPEWPQGAGFKVLEARRNSRKLRIGSHRQNRFTLRLRAVQGDRHWIEDRLAMIVRNGVPNYFGLQRFGRDGQNLERGLEWLFSGRRLGRSRQSMALSAVRSALFNNMLSEAIKAGRWQSVEAGDAVMLSGSNSVFRPTGEELASTRERIARGDCSASLLLPGGDAFSRACNDFESQWLGEYEDCIAALDKRRVQSSRRPQALHPSDLSWDWEDNQTLILQFALSRGAFATSLLRELVVLDQE